MRTIIGVSFTVLGLACAGGETADTAADAAAPDFETTRIAEGVYQFRFNRHQGLFVVASDGIVAVDPISTEAAGHYADEIKRVAPGVPLKAIVYSHRDADHATGAAVLQEAFGETVPIYAHPNAVAPLEAANDSNLPPPTISVDGRTVIGTGDDAVELHPVGKSHSDDMLVTFVPARGVAFAVDFVTNDGLGYRDLASFYFPEQFDALAALQALPYERIVFGHGAPGDRETVERQIGYYRDLDAAVREAIADGLSEDEAAAAVMLPDYADWARYDEFRELNVRGMYRKLAG